MNQAERDRLVEENDRLAGWYVRRFVSLPQTDPGHDDLVQAAISALPREPDENAPAVLMYTGGTTGSPATAGGAPP